MAVDIQTLRSVLKQALDLCLPLRPYTKRIEFLLIKMSLLDLFNAANDKAEGKKKNKQKVESSAKDQKVGVEISGNEQSRKEQKVEKDTGSEKSKRLDLVAAELKSNLEKLNFVFDQKYLEEIINRAKTEILSDGLSSKHPRYECRRLMQEVTVPLQILLTGTFRTAAALGQALTKSSELQKLLNKRNPKLLYMMNGFFEQFLNGDNNLPNPSIFSNAGNLAWEARMEARRYSKGYAVYLYHSFVLGILTVYENEPFMVKFFEKTSPADFESLRQQALKHMPKESVEGMIMPQVCRYFKYPQDFPENFGQDAGVDPKLLVPIDRRFADYREPGKVLLKAIQDPKIKTVFSEDVQKMFCGNRATVSSSLALNSEMTYGAFPSSGHSSPFNLGSETKERESEFVRWHVDLFQNPDAVPVQKSDSVLVQKPAVLFSIELQPVRKQTATTQVQSGEQIPRTKSQHEESPQEKSQIEPQGEPKQQKRLQQKNPPNQ